MVSQHQPQAGATDVEIPARAQPARDGAQYLADDGRAWPSITNVGYRPTFDHDGHAEGGLSIETFLLEPLAGSTPRRIRVEFLWRVRDERKFPDAHALKSQILRDAARAQAYFRRLNKWTNGYVYPVDSMA